MLVCIVLTVGQTYKDNKESCMCCACVHIYYLLTYDLLGQQLPGVV